MNHTKDHVTTCLKAYLEADRKCHRSPCAYSSIRRNDTPEWKEYEMLNDARNVAFSALWAATDFEYNEDGFRDVCWNWRYWKVMARKCCWYQKNVKTNHLAAQTMAEMSRAFAKMVEVCGLGEGFMSSCDYLEEAFPNLKCAKPVCSRCNGSGLISRFIFPYRCGQCRGSGQTTT